MELLCRTVSNTLLKSKATTTTYRLFSSACVTLFRRATSAAVVESFGLKAYWSVKHSVARGQSSAKYRKSRTMIHMEVTDSGRKSLGCFGFDVFGTGQILVRFHCVGTVDVLTDRLMRSARVLLNTGAPRRMNHADTQSRPVAVGFSLSGIRNIVCSVILSNAQSWMAVRLAGGWMYALSVEMSA